jgi:hypothetical protein
VAGFGILVHEAQIAHCQVLLRSERLEVCLAEGFSHAFPDNSVQYRITQKPSICEAILRRNLCVVNWWIHVSRQYPILSH